MRVSVPGFCVEVSKPSPSEQFDAWSKILGAEEGDAASTLSGQFDLNLADIQEVGALAAKAPSEEGPLSERVWDASRDMTRPRLDALAQRMDVKATWNDLVLSDEQMALMRSIAGQVRGRHMVYDKWGFSLKMNRGFGITRAVRGRERNR